MPEGSSFTIKDLGAAIAKALGLTEGDEVEIQKDKFDANRILIIRHRTGSGDGSPEGDIGKALQTSGCVDANGS